METMTVNFNLGESSIQKRLIFLPSVGELVTLTSTRDENGNYVHRSAQAILSGVVVRIEHIIEERGQSSNDWSLTHFVEVYLEELPQ